MKYPEKKVESVSGYVEDLALHLVRVQKSCANCHYGDHRRESVVEYLRARGITQVTDAHGQAVPGENTVARDFQWGDIMRTLDSIVLCRKPDAKGGPQSEMVDRAYRCDDGWEEDHGLIVVPSAGIPKP